MMGPSAWRRCCCLAGGGRGSGGRPHNSEVCGPQWGPVIHGPICPKTRQREDHNIPIEIDKVTRVPQTLPLSTLVTCASCIVAKSPGRISPPKWTAFPGPPRGCLLRPAGDSAQRPERWQNFPAGLAMLREGKYFPCGSSSAPPKRVASPPRGAASGFWNVRPRPQGYSFLDARAVQGEAAVDRTESARREREAAGAPHTPRG